MPRRNFLLPAIALVAIALFTCLLVRLLLLRYERGDIYPAYSTLRADPLGTRALYESLGSIDGYTVSRGYTPLHRELEEKPGALFYLGLSSYEIMFYTKEEVTQLDGYVKNGGRMVIALEPEDPIGASDDEDKDKKKDEKKKTEAKPSDKDAKPAGKDETSPDKEATQPEPADNSTPQTQQEKYERDELRKEDDEDDTSHKKATHPTKYHPSLAALWGFGWERQHDETIKKKDDASDSSDDEDDEKKKEKPEVLAFSTSNDVAEATVPWKSALYFVRLEPDWQVLYNAKGKPVLIRRAWGKGEIIIATDSYLVSNEALRDNRRPVLLGLLAGSGGSLLFDETHLGTQAQEGVMYLAEKYKLEGYLYGMLGVVVLILWRNSVPLVPPRVVDANARLGGTVSGKDSRSGLVNLLRRNIGTRDILKASFAEWKRHVTPTRAHLHGRMAEMENILATGETNSAEKIVESYHQLRNINTPSHARGTYATKS